MTCQEMQLDLMSSARERAYHAFREANPTIVADFAARALGYWRDGFRRLSARMIWEEMRAAGIRERRGEFHLNNNHLPFIVRDFLAAHPACGVFETRSKSEKPGVSRRAR
jgi:hypothetical protein